VPRKGILNPPTATLSGHLAQFWRSQIGSFMALHCQFQRLRERLRGVLMRICTIQCPAKHNPLWAKGIQPYHHHHQPRHQACI